ncbi:t-SNARE [Teratosphaeria nubilosa]|uniref:t-SNARE n=1 Tax=Teratosphaeria nubilosa TaxID=161662 RepID=A0A6G1L472_9PEZI|nr:t-SNARE [Teratosphaeria nubilosa]
MSSTDKIGAWRDRTGLYLSYRLSYGHNPNKRARLNAPNDGFRYSDNAGDSERAGLMSNIELDGDAVIEMDLLPPRWLDIQDEITTSLSEISTKMKKLEQLHAKHVLPGFDDESVKAREEREIESLTQEITRGFTTCQNRIRRIDTLVASQRSTSRGAIPLADEKMAQNLKISLAAKVGETSTLFRKKQSAYLKKLRSLGGMTTPMDTRSATPAAANPYTDPALMDSESDRASAQSTLLQSAQVRRRQTGIHDAAIEQREREIEKIAQGVIELSQIFQELNSMVIDQGTLLDRIDYNVERTHEAVKGAEKELKVATGYQKKSTKRKIILLLVLIVVGMFILLLVKPKNRGTRVVQTPVPAAPPSVGEGAGTGGEDAGGKMLKAREVWDPVSGHQRRRWEWKQRRRRDSIGRRSGRSSSL